MPKTVLILFIFRINPYSSLSNFRKKTGEINLQHVSDQKNTKKKTRQLPGKLGV